MSGSILFQWTLLTKYLIGINTNPIQSFPEKQEEGILPNSFYGICIT
jgi:hypothetical protein